MYEAAFSHYFEWCEDSLITEKKKKKSQVALAMQYKRSS